MKGQNPWWNKIIIDKNQIKLFNRFKTANAFYEENAISTNNIQYSLLFPPKIYTIIQEKYIYINPIEIKRSAKKKWRIFSIILCLFGFLCYIPFPMKPDKYGPGLHLEVLAIFMILTLGMAYLETFRGFPKFFKNIWVNQFGECNYREGGGLTNEHKL